MTNEEAIMILKASNRPSTPLQLDLADRSLRAAERQMARIWNFGVAPDASDFEGRKIFHQDILADVHFYFVSLRNVYVYLKAVIDDPAFANLRTDFDQLNKRWLSHYSDARKAFEHMSSRLPGGKEENQIKGVAAENGTKKINYGLSMQQGFFRHSDQEWDITPVVFQSLKQEVMALRQKIIATCTG